MAKRDIVVGNWKMNPRTAKEAVKLFTEVAKNLKGVRNPEIVICPPLIYLEALKKISKRIVLGAQNCFIGDTGAFTGEVSADMLYNMGVKYVILGHSERRELGESDQLINKKIKSALEAGLAPILCVGEKERDENHQYFNTVKEQLRICLAGIARSSLPKIVIAYEPVWAISTTVNRHDATALDCLEMAMFIRKVLSDFGGEDTKKMRVIYGGSVNERDVVDFLKDGGVDGVLAGRSSLDPRKFTQIVQICEDLTK